MIAMSCQACGRAFEAKRQTAKFCTSACRVRAHQAAKSGRPITPDLPRHREGAAVVALPPLPAEAAGITSATERELRSAGRLDTVAGQLALLSARLLDSGVQDTGSSMAALIRQHLATVEKALDGAVAAETPLEKIRRERELKVG
jgi:hypothetical protein